MRPFYQTRLRRSVERQHGPLLPKLRELIDERGMTLREAGEELGAHPSTVQRWLRRLESQLQEATAYGTNGTASHSHSVVGAHAEAASPSAD